MSGKVYVVQEPYRVRYDDAGNPIPYPALNLDPARVYGELVHLLPQGNTTYAPAQTVRMIRDVMQDFTAQDYILPVGNPAVIGVAVAIAAQKNGGSVNVLHWDKRERAYHPLQFNIN